MDCIASDILVSIFSYLSEDDKVSCMKTCKRFHSILSTKTECWHFVIISKKNILSSEYLEICRNISKLPIRYLIIKIKTFTLVKQQCDTPFELLSGFEPSFLSTLIVLDFQISNTHDEIMEFIPKLSINNGMEHLTNLELLHTRQFTLYDIKNLGYLKNIQNLQIFFDAKFTKLQNISEFRLNSDGQQCILSNLKSMYVGRHINTHEDSHDIEVVFHGIKSPNIEILSIQNFDVTITIKEDLGIVKQKSHGNDVKSNNRKYYHYLFNIFK
jgi:hypothetical protein